MIGTDGWTRKMMVDCVRQTNSAEIESKEGEKERRREEEKKRRSDSKRDRQTERSEESMDGCSRWNYSLLNSSDSK